MPTTTMSQLYKTLCQVVISATGRKIWSKGGIQATPNFPYATVFLSMGDGFAKDTIINVPLSTPGPNQETLKQYVRSTLHLQCVAEFYRSNGDNDTAAIAALRFKQALQLQEREYDLWRICGLTGPIQFIDTSAIFRADTEPRAQVRFYLYANLGEEPLNGTDLSEISKQPMQIEFNSLDDHITIISKDIENTGG